jgi:hypothetical protein
MYVGAAPATILCVNWRTGKLVDSFTYSMNAACAVHGLKVMPDPL